MKHLTLTEKAIALVALTLVAVMGYYIGLDACINGANILR